MIFSSVEFLFLFLPAVLLAYYLPIKSLAYKNLILLAASLAFYAWGEPVFVFIMLISITANWVLSLLIEKSSSVPTRKLWLSASIIWNVTLLGIFKYAGFIAETFSLLLKNDTLTVNIALPIGISFFTFQIMSYVIDVYRKTTPAQKNLLLMTLYISLFPRLATGPIVRYSSVADEITNRPLNSPYLAKGFVRFIIGLAKKLLLANYAAFVADKIFNLAAAGGAISVASAWLGAIAYTIQIYHDFSGYSDMAVGLGLMFGFHFPENFNYPYIAKSVQDFWSRWHISLSMWFRDYVYIPLGGNRRSPARVLFNTFIVWLLTGIWHGANWTFIFWGLYYFCFLTLERKTRLHERLGKFSYAYAALIFVFGWVCFRANSLPTAFSYYASMLGIGAAGLTDGLFFILLKNGAVPLAAGIICSFPIIPALKTRLPAKLYDVLGAISVATLFIVSLMACIQNSYSPFIYFNF